MKNYQKVNVPAGEARVELHDSLNLTGAEVSISNLPAGAGVPFVHSHKQNEEIYAVLSGRGTMVVDGEIVELQAGDWLRVAPAGERQLSAAADSAISVICIQIRIIVFCLLHKSFSVCEEQNIFHIIVAP